MKKISNKEFLEPLKNRPGLESSIEFKNQLKQELQNMKPRKQRMKSIHVAFLAGVAAVMVLIIFSSDFLKQPAHESKASPMLLRTMENDKGNALENQTESLMQTITSEKYHVSLGFPGGWKLANGYADKYGGEDGFVQLSAFSGGGYSIDEVAKWAAEHHLNPFGTAPEITTLEIGGNEARLIMPSDDQPKEDFKRAEVIIKYPKPMMIGGSPYSFFLLDADVDHIREIAETVQFLD